MRRTGTIACRSRGLSRKKLMNVDPQKFFIGLMGFFSILLPGALLTYLLMGAGFG